MPTRARGNTAFASGVNKKRQIEYAAFMDLGKNGAMAPLSHIDPRTMPPAEVKSAWRSVVRRLRLQRGERRNTQDALAFRDTVLALPELQGISCASVYASRSYEPGTLPLIQALAEQGVDVLIPRLGDGLQRGWSVYSSPDDIVERSPGRPPEPSGEFLPQDALERADVIIVPALAADSAGTRLGQGAGWYDRALKDARPGVPVIALVFEDEYHEASERSLPCEFHDAPVSMVVTPSQVIRIEP